MPRPSRTFCSRPDQAVLRLPSQALLHYLPPERVEQLAEGAGWLGRHRVFDPCTTLFTCVDQALHGQSSQLATVSRLSAAQAAWLTARDLAPGPRRWLLDGSTLALAPSAANQAAYPQSTCQPAGCSDPQVHLVALVDQATGCAVQVELGTLSDHDAKLARPLWDRIPRGDAVPGVEGAPGLGAGARGHPRVGRNAPVDLAAGPQPALLRADRGCGAQRPPTRRVQLPGRAGGSGRRGHAAFQRGGAQLGARRDHP